MSIKKLPRRITVQKSVAGTSGIYLRRNQPKGKPVVNSGCMRGNDSYGNNGSASVGISPEKPVQQQSYNDFVHFNYGQPSQRQYTGGSSHES